MSCYCLFFALCFDHDSCKRALVVIVVVVVVVVVSLGLSGTQGGR